MKRIQLLFLILLSSIVLKAEEGDSIRLSLLTCGPGEEIYSLFGHTAIRYEDPQRGIDAVFNYGVFSFNTPNFVLRFTLGETDYQLGVTSYERFRVEYAYLGREVRQQVLDLRPQEKLRLVELLEENYRPENRIYRYNFFYDNCATRPRDRIEQAVEGRLLYAEDMETTETGETFRSLLHRYTDGHPWSRFGIDLCIGSAADRPICRRQMMFVPFYVEDFFRTARVAEPDGTERPLVSREEQLLKAGEAEPEDLWTWLTPLRLFTGLFVVVAAVTLYGLRRRRPLWALDVLLFLPAGVSGCILAFMACFSQHPAVSPNHLLWVLHPLHLFCLPWFINRIRKGQRSLYMGLNCLVLTLFMLLCPLIPQKFDLAVLPLALCLWLRSASNLILTYKKQLKE